jgi:hypothetical protein
MPLPEKPPALAGGVITTSGSGRNELTEQIVTIVPAPRSSISGKAARVVRTAAKKLIARVELQSSSVIERNPLRRGRTAPTLFTRMSSRP